MIKTFKEFITETYLDNQPTPEYLKNDFDKMKKNGYISVKLLKDVEDNKKGEELMTSSSEFGTFDEDSLVTCYTKDGDKVLVIKSDLEVQNDKKSEKK